MEKPSESPEYEPIQWDRVSDEKDVPGQSYPSCWYGSEKATYTLQPQLLQKQNARRFNRDALQECLPGGHRRPNERLQKALRLYQQVAPTETAVETYFEHWHRRWKSQVDSQALAQLIATNIIEIVHWNHV